MASNRFRKFAPLYVSFLSSRTHFAASFVDKSCLSGSTLIQSSRTMQFQHASLSTTSDSAEVKASKSASSPLDNEPTIFDKIISREIPADVVYEDNEALAFRDVSPQAPVHILVIPKVRSGLTRLTMATIDHKALLGHIFYVASEVARQEGLDKEGCRFVVNDGVHGAQSVYHLHIHILGGRQMNWPPG